MGYGPIEIIVVVFEGYQFTGEILPELKRLVDTVDPNQLPVIAEREGAMA